MDNMKSQENLKTMCAIIDKDTYMDKPGEYKNSGNENQKVPDSKTALKTMCVIVPKEDKHTASCKKNATPVTSNVNTVTANKCIQPIKDGYAQTTPVIANPKLVPNGMQPNPQKAVKLPIGENLVNLESVISNEESQHNIMRAFIKDVAVKVRNGRIYVYNGKYYEDCDSDDIKRLLLKLYRKKLCGKSASYYSGIVDYIKIEPEIEMTDSVIRRDLLSCSNFVVDLNTGATYPHDPSRVTTYCINAAYTPDFPVESPWFDHFLKTTCGNDPAWIERLYQIIGYCLTSDTKAKSIFVFQGVGNSGKSLLCSLLLHLYSKNSYLSIKPSKLSSQFALAPIFGKTLLVANDLGCKALDPVAVSHLKELSGNDVITGDVKFKAPITFINTSKIILTSNHSILPQTKDDAFMARLVALPFEFGISKDKQITNLLDLLISEASSIVTKSLQAYFRLRASGYIFAGDFEVNSVIDTESFSEDISMSVYTFVLRTFEPADDKSFVFTEDAHASFILNHVYIHDTVFAKHFKRYSEEIFGVKHDRQRKPGATNATSCVRGLRFKDVL